MIRDVWTTIVPRPSDGEMLVAKVPKGGAANRWQAQRVINAVRAKVPLEHRNLPATDGGWQSSTGDRSGSEDLFVNLQS